MIAGSDDAIRHMRSCGLKVLFCTNNSSKTRDSIANKLVNMGIDCSANDVVSSAYVAANYCVAHGYRKMFVSGTGECVAEFEGAGADLCDEDDAETLVVAMNTDYNYEIMTKATRVALKSKQIVLCNEDRLYPTESGPSPGCGAITSSILYCSGRKADVVIGKPNTIMMEHISEKWGYAASEMIVIGDSIQSDIAMAVKYGSDYLLVSRDDCTIPHITSLVETVGWDWTNLKANNDVDS